MKKHFLTSLVRPQQSLMRLSPAVPQAPTNGAHRRDLRQLKMEPRKYKIQNSKCKILSIINTSINYKRQKNYKYHGNKIQNVRTALIDWQRTNAVECWLSFDERPNSPVFKTLAACLIQCRSRKVPHGRVLVSLQCR